MPGRAERRIALAAAAALLCACSGKKHHAMDAGSDGGMTHPAQTDAGPKGPKDAQVTKPPLDAGPAGGGGSGGMSATNDEDAGVACNLSACQQKGDACNLAYCDKKTGECKLMPRPDGTACGRVTQNECTAPDSCQAGVCVPNDAPAGTPCGAQVGDCYNADACDGHGQCAVGGPKPEGSACGDSSASACDQPDTCDANGVCQSNYAPLGAACGDQGVACHNDDSCDGQGQCVDNGLWMAGACPLGENAQGCRCGDQSLTECHPQADYCDNGSCTSVTLPDGSACGSHADNECDKPDTCSGGQCVTNYVPQGSACGNRTTDTACDRPDVCDGSGGCDPSFSPSNTVCGAPVDECHLESRCNGSGSCGAGAPAPLDTMCGDSSESACDHADSCDGNGLCRDNLASAGATCGDQSGTECDHPDSCDGSGACQPNYAAAGSACGDRAATCLVADACDGSGGCIDNGVISPCGIVGTVTAGGSPVSGVTVEVLGSIPASTTTGTNGRYQLSVPLLEDAILHVAGINGYWGAAQVRRFTAQDAGRSFNFALQPDSAVQVPGTSVGLTADTSKGEMVLTFGGGFLVGTEGATLSAQSAMPIAFGSSGYLYSSSIMSTQNGSPLIFMNTAPGNTSVTPVSASSNTCTLSASSLSQFPVYAHVVTTLDVICE